MKPEHASLENTHRRDRNIRPPRVTPEEHAAFGTEMKLLRHTIKKVMHERWKYIDQRKLPPLHLVQAWKAESAATMERLDHWESILCIEATNEIRSPVRLWDSLNSLRWLTEGNECELNDYLEHAKTQRATR